MLSTLEIVAVLAKLPSVSLSVPSPRSTEPFESCVESVIVSAPVPPMRVSTFETEPVLAKSPSVSLSVPAPRSMLPSSTSAAPSVIVSAPDAADRASRRSRSSPCWRSRRASALSAAGAEIDRGVRGDGAERDRVGARAADDALDVGDGGRVGEIAEGERVVPAAEVDRGVRGLRREGDRVGARCRRSASRRWRPSPCSRSLPSVSASEPDAEVDAVGCPESRAERDGVGSSCRRRGSRRSRRSPCWRRWPESACRCRRPGRRSPWR